MVLQRARHVIDILVVVIYPNVTSNTDVSIGDTERWAGGRMHHVGVVYFGHFDMTFTPQKYETSLSLHTPMEVAIFGNKIVPISILYTNAHSTYYLVGYLIK